MTEQLLSFKEACELLDISDKVLMRLLAEESIPARKIGGKWIFSKAALVEWISRGDSKSYSKSSAMEEDESD